MHPYKHLYGSSSNFSFMVQGLKSKGQMQDFQVHFLLLKQIYWQRLTSISICPLMQLGLLNMFMRCLRCLKLLSSFSGYTRITNIWEKWANNCSCSIVCAHLQSVNSLSRNNNNNNKIRKKQVLGFYFPSSWNFKQILCSTAENDGLLVWQGQGGAGLVLVTPLLSTTAAGTPCFSWIDSSCQEDK